MNKIVIRNGFIRDENGFWIGLHSIKYFFVDENTVKYENVQESFHNIKTFKSNKQSQKELDTAFNIYKGNDLPLEETLDEYDLSLPLRVQGRLNQENINTVGDFYDLLEKGTAPIGIGSKSWGIMKDTYKRIKILFV